MTLKYVDGRTSAEMVAALKDATDTILDDARHINALQERITDLEAQLARAHKRVVELLELNADLAHALEVQELQA